VSPDDLEKLIVARRSNIQIDPDAHVDPTIIERITSVIQWAPNHKRTWPARVAVVSGESRRRLGDVIADAMAAHGDNDAKVDKTRTKYLRSPILLVIAAAHGSSPTETEENRYSVAAGTQNLLLMTESFGLAALWGSPAKGANDAITGFCGFDPTDHVMGLIYVGWPRRDTPDVARPDLRISRLD
jgi:nitroreductase